MAKRHIFFPKSGTQLSFQPTFTSLCRSNVNLIMVQKLARHSDPKLTSNIYSKASTTERTAAINGIALEG